MTKGLNVLFKKVLNRNLRFLLFYVSVPVYKKYKCKMNGNNLVWDPLLFAPSNCKQNYEKLANVLKFRCQAFCVKECDNS